MTANQKAIIKVIKNGERAEGILGLIGGQIGHSVYEYVKVDVLIELIRVLTKKKK